MRIGLPRVDAAGVYGWLLAREEAAARCAGGRLDGRFGGEGPWSYDHVPARLEALRAGWPVNVPSGSLPGWAQTEAPTRRGRFGAAIIRPARAIVAADDSITWSDEGWARLWLEENDL
jgi:hypothetical protein